MKENRCGLGLSRVNINIISSSSPSNIHFIINSPSGKIPREDEVRIRNASLAQKIPIMTTLRAAQATTRDLSSMRALAAPGLTPERRLAMQEAFGTPPLADYGLSEVPGHAAHGVDEPEAKMLTTEGRPFEGTEIRILGCLIEKQATNPETYPLTLNALVLACNQKTSREPVMNLSPGQVGQSLRALEGQGFTRLVMGSRADRWEHRVDKALELVPAQVILTGLLFLRGPQTVNELLTRSGRMHDFEVSTVLPAHGHPFHDLAGRADDIARHHDERLDILRNVGRSELHLGTVAEFMRYLFKERAWGDMAESETFAHLEHLRLLGEATVTEVDGLLAYAIND